VHFAVYFALKKMVSIFINFLFTGENDSRFNNGEAEIPVDHKPKIGAREAQISKSSGCI
jgi:hypothetical protein